MNLSHIGIVLGVMTFTGNVFAQQTIDLKLSPTTEPTPALRWRLMPAEHELHSGNAAPFYARAALMNRVGTPETQEFLDERYRWTSCPMIEFPVAKARAYLQRKQSVLREMEYAARCRECDWQLAGRLKVDGININLEDLQACRELASLLNLHIRVAIAEDRFDDAIHSLQTGFALARHLGQQPTLIVGLIGAAIHAIMSERVDDLISRPNAPSLYWALTTLPRPFIDVQASMVGELFFQAELAPSLEKLEAGPLSNEEALRMLEVPFRAMGQIQSPTGEAPVPERFTLAGLTLINYARAKRELIAQGMDAELIERMPSAQVVALHSSRRYHVLRDDFLKWTYLPWHEAIPGSQRAMKNAESFMRETPRSDFTLILFQLLMPAMERVLMAYARADRRTAAFRTIEAIRLEAGANGGKLPARLEDIKTVPVPDDPLTAKPFSYQLDGDAAVLTLPPPEGEDPNRGNAFRFRLTLRK